MTKFFIQTLGCKLNFAESSTLARKLTELGWEQVSQNQQADWGIINSCTVTEHAEKKCRQAARKFMQTNPSGKLIVTGCYAKLRPEELKKIEGIHDVVDKNKVLHYLCDIPEDYGHFFAAFSSGDRTRSFLKVQDGCNYHCAYCAIPEARGESRNIPIAQIVEQAKEVASKGIREIVLTGINTGDFGRTTHETLLDLLVALNRVEGIERFRISSIEPNLLTDEIIHFCAQSPKFLPHFHIPLQAGSDAVLAAMGRRYNTGQFVERIRKLRAEIPDVFIGVDVIVGFPTETDQDFENCYQMLKDLAVSYLHIFPYSVRPNTRAALLPQLAASVIHDRAKRLGELCLELHRNYYQQHIGKEVNVLFESKSKEGYLLGYSENYLRVALPYSRNEVNQIVRCRLQSLIHPELLLGERIYPTHV